jgi:dTDP-4-dehydrorhamnose reductase
MIKLLITGGTGFVGKNLADYFRTRHEVMIVSRHPLPFIDSNVSWNSIDIKDREKTISLIRKQAPNVIIHAAGNKDVRYCENNADEAFLVNSIGTRNVAQAAGMIGAKMIYISTDLIFPSTAGNYTELDIPHSPLAYGRSKYAGESYAILETDNLAICRTGGLYGRYSPLLNWLSRELIAGKEVVCFTDVYNTPTYVMDLAEAIATIIERDIRGIFHTAGKQRINRYDFFRCFAQVFNLDDSRLKPSRLGAKREAMLLMPDCSLSCDISIERMGIYFKSPLEGFSCLKEEGL